MNIATSSAQVVPSNQKHVSLTPELVTYLDQQRSGFGDPIFDEIRLATAQFGEDAIMQVPDHQGSLLSLLVQLTRTTAALEIGTFTGSSSICIARGLSDKGKLICMDTSKVWTDVARQFWQKAGLESKIELQLGDALERIAQFAARYCF